MNAQQREIVKTLIQIVWADGHVDDREREILGKMLAELGLSRKDLAEVGHMMTEAPESPNLEVILKQGVEERRELMLILLHLAMNNGHLNPPEVRYVQAIASKLEISKDELEELKEQVRAMTKKSKK